MRGGPAAAVQLLAVAVEHEPHGPARALRELDGHAAASKPAFCLPPKPPPMYSAITRTRSFGTSKRRVSSSRASKMPCVAIQQISSSGFHQATAACGSIGVCSCPGVSTWSSTRDLGGGQGGVDVAARVLERIAVDALVAEGGLDVDDERQRVDLQRERRTPALAAASVSAATTAIGAPA